MPVMGASSPPSAATAVTAASAAVPPARSVSSAATLASGCEVATIPSSANTVERPGRWKSRVMESRWGRGETERGRSCGVNVVGAFDRYGARRGADRETGRHVGEGDDDKQEESAGGRLPDQQELGDHRAEQQRRQQMVDDRTGGEPRRFEHLEKQDHDGAGDQEIAGSQ